MILQTLHYITLHYMTLHYDITLHCVALHYITSIYEYIFTHFVNLRHCNPIRSMFTTMYQLEIKKTWL